MGKLRKRYDELTDKRKSIFKDFMNLLLAFFIKGYDVLKKGFDFFITREDRIIKKIMREANLTNIDNYKKDKLKYALKETIKDVSEKKDHSLSYYVVEKRDTFESLIYDNYIKDLILGEDSDDSIEIKKCITEITDKTKNNIKMFESTETTTQTNLEINANRKNDIDELNKKVTAQGKDIEELKGMSPNVSKNSDNSIKNNNGVSTKVVDKKDNDDTNEKTEIEGTPKLKQKKPLFISLIVGLIVVSAIGIIIYKMFILGNNNKKTNNKPITSTTTNTKVSTTSEPIITTETVTTMQKETETQSTVIQTSTTISNNPNNEVTFTENTSPEQTTLPPIETTTVVTEPPSHSNEESKFICEEYHINAIEDFCEDMSGVIITGYKGTLPEHLIIPAQIDDKHVIAIGEGVFSGYNIKSLVIPDTVYEIQANAFRNCSYLSNIYLGINVLKIGDQAFFCSQYTGDGKQTITTPNPKFTDDEEAAFHGKQWDGRNHDYIIQIEY